MRKELLVGDVAVAPLPGGGFGACQVSGITDEATTLHALDWSSPEPPVLDDLRGAGPVPLTYRDWADRIAQTSIFRGNHAMPPDFDWVGNLPVPPGVPAHVDSYSGWTSPFGDLVRQRHWDEQVPAATKEAFLASRGLEPVTADLGAGPFALTSTAGKLDLVSGMIPVPETGPADWTVLDLLPRCTDVSWSGPDRGLAEALSRHPLISNLYWYDAPPVVDLSGTHVHVLHISGDELREIRLPSGVRRLTLGPTGDRCTVRADDDGRWLDLHLFQATDATRAPGGLGQVRAVTLSGPGVFSAATVDRLAAAHTLELHWSRPPGRLDDPALLLGLPSLQLIEMINAYGVDTGTLPDLPLLRHIWVHGLRGSVARGLRERFRGTEVELSLAGAKTDSWVATNLDNPFRDWADDNARAGAAACKAYATALRAIDKLSAPARSGRSRATASARATAATREATATKDAAPVQDAVPTPATGSAGGAGAGRPAVPGTGSAEAAVVAAAEPILHELIDKLHAIDGKYQILDTLRREEAGDAFVNLAARAGVPAALAGAWFDAWRDF